MPQYTTHYNLAKPLVADAIDEDLWGGYLNDNFDSLDTLIYNGVRMLTSTKTSTYSVLVGDVNKMFLADATGGPITFNLPLAATAGAGFHLIIKKTDVSTNAVIIDGAGSETIDGVISKSITTQYGAISLTSDGLNWYVDSNIINTFDQTIQVRDEKTNGTAGGAFTSGGWRTRTLNTTVVNSITGASLSANRITLPIGTYRIQSSVNAEDVAKHKAKLYNITSGADIIIGTNARSSNTSASDTSSSFINGRFELTAQSELEIQHRCDSSGTFGSACSFSVPEVYLDVVIWKVA